MIQIKIHENAALEFEEAIQWYESKQKDLGKRFRKQVVKHLKLVSQHPKWYPFEKDNIHKAYIPQFPFKILFTVEGDILIVYAIVHMRRKPNYWTNRIKD